MNDASHEISRRVILETVGPDGPAPIEGELRYSQSDPYAVSVVFMQGGGEIAWVFGRDLLIRGVSEPAGDGDVQVFPSLDPDGRGVVGLMLYSPAGQALVHAAAKDILEFLADSTRVVWPGTESEYLSADDAIAAILVSD